MSSRQKIEVVRTLDELAAYEGPWHALATNALESNIFYEPSMLLPALRDLVAPEPWQTVLVTHEGRLVALVPLQRKQVGGFESRSVLQLLRHRHSFLHTPLFHRDHAEAAARAFFRWACAGSGAGIIAATRVTVDGPVFALLRREFEKGGGRWAEMRRWSRPLLVPTGDADAYLQSVLSGERRRQLARRKRGLEELGRLSLHVLQPTEDIGPWLSAFLELEASGWKGRAGTALAHSPAQTRFFVSTATGFHRRNQAIMMGLRLADRWIAMACYFRAAAEGGGAFWFKPAFDETLKKLSPGVQLETEIIRLFLGDYAHVGWVDSCTNPANELIGRLWQGRREIGDVMIMPAGWRGHLGRLALRVGLLARAARNWQRSRPAPPLPAETGSAARKSRSRSGTS